MKIDVADRFIGPYFARFLKHDWPFIQSVIRPEYRQTGTSRAHGNWPVNRTWPAMHWAERWVILEGAVLRRVEHLFGYKLQDIGHHADVSIKRLHEFQCFRCLPRCRLMYRDTLLICELGKRIFGLAFFGRRATNGNDILVARYELFKHGFTKCLLTMKCNSQESLPLILNPIRPTVTTFMSFREQTSAIHRRHLTQRSCLIHRPHSRETLTISRPYARPAMATA